MSRFSDMSPGYQATCGDCGETRGKVFATPEACRMFIDAGGDCWNCGAVKGKMKVVVYKQNKLDKVIDLMEKDESL